MKTTGKESAGRKLYYCPSRASRVETALYGALGLIGTGAIVIALIAGSLPLDVRNEPMDGVVKYVRSGRAVADLRTAGAIVHYLLENEKSVATNQASPSGANPMPRTNASGPGPKV